MKKNKNVSDSVAKQQTRSTVKKTSFVNLVISLLIQSLSLNKDDGEIRQFKNIGKYQLLRKIEKENSYTDSMVGCYTKNGKKFFIKTYSIDRKDYKNYFITGEWIVSNILYKVLKSKKGQIVTPKPIKIISFDNSTSLVYEFIDAKTLTLYSTNYQTKIFIQVIDELKKISTSLTRDEIKHLPKRSLFFYLISLPYLSLLAFFRTEGNFKIVMKAFLMTLEMLISQKINSRLSLAHRDLKPHNIMIKGSKIFLIDTGRMALTLPGYDLALLSLDPAYLSLTKNLEKELKIFISKFLKSYIAIQFADSSDSVGKKYWKFLRTEYTTQQSFPKKNNFSISLLFSKSILAYRYFYHMLFSNFYHLGARVTFKQGVSIHNGKHIYLGDRVYLEKNVTLKFLEEFENFGYKLPNLKIDNGVTVGVGTIIAAAKLIHIKKDVLIASYCFIGDHDHEYSNINIPIRDQGYKNVKEIIIEKGAWIGANSTICSGVTVGKNSVVGANSVVTGDIPQFSLAVGIPAKVIKKFSLITKKWEEIE